MSSILPRCHVPQDDVIFLRLSSRLRTPLTHPRPRVRRLPRIRTLPHGTATCGPPSDISERPHSPPSKAATHRKILVPTPTHMSLLDKPRRRPLRLQEPRRRLLRLLSNTRKATVVTTTRPTLFDPLRT